MQVRDGMSTRGPDRRTGAHAARGRRADGGAPRRGGGRPRPRRDGARDHHRARRPAVGRRAAQDPDAERVADHLTADLVFARPTWSLEQAAAAMVRGGFRHSSSSSGGEIAGILSVRDIVRCWTDDGATCDVPQSARRSCGRAGGDARSQLAAARAWPAARRSGRPRSSSAAEWSSGSSSISRRVFAIQRDGDEEQQRPGDHQDSEIVTPIDRERDPDRVEERQQARRREVDLLAGGRGRRVARAGS